MLNRKYIKPSSPDYPESFKTLPQRPSFFIVGKFNQEATRVGIVGSRRPTAYGLRFTAELSQSLAKAGVETVSGFARGIDSCCHSSTIAEGGRTIAILGSGLDKIYPPENKALFKDVSEKGAIITEFSDGTPPFKQNFPRRNRLISALSDLLIVVEAAEKSGTLITVDFALEQGKDVMALPGSIYSKQSEGTNKLIKQGAEPITTVEQVLNKLNINIENMRSNDDNVILRLLKDEAMSVEEIAVALKKPIDQISIEIMNLQIQGFLKEDLAGKYYRAC